MICSCWGLDQLGYARSCAIHDQDYGEARTYRHKFRRDSFLAHNMRKLGKWHSLPIAFMTFCTLSTSPYCYYKYFKNLNNAAGHALSLFWLGLAAYQIWTLL